MGIQVGEKNPRTIKTEEIGQQYRQTMNSKADAEAAAAAEKKRMDDAKKQAQNRIEPKTIEEEKAALSHDNDLLTRIMALPKEEQPKALRDAGYPLLADQKEGEIKEEKERADKLASIMAMPEDDRVGALLDAGFTEEAAAENKRIGLAKQWSAVISLLSQYGRIKVNVENTHAVLEQASAMEDDASRIAYCRENGLADVADLFEAVLNGKTIAEIDEELKAQTPPADEGEKNGQCEGVGDADAAPAPESETAEGTGDAAPEGGDAAPAEEAEKRKVGRPAGSTKKQA